MTSETKHSKKFSHLKKEIFFENEKLVSYSLLVYTR